MAEISSQQKELFDRLLAGRLEPGDAEAIANWLGNSDLDQASRQLLLEHLQQHSETWDSLAPEIRERLDQRLPLIFSSRPARPALVHVLGGSGWIKYAAAVIILIALSWFALTKPWIRDAQPLPVAQSNTMDIVEPGRDGAILTLENGSKLVLDSMGNGVLTTENGTQILLRDGQLLYQAGDVSSDVVGYNTMSTPKGRQFKLRLPDGSNVWLNAASSIRYPTAFVGAERRVEITGEAYFEVAHRDDQPFRVTVDQQTEVEVLGTHFNINSYNNEDQISTTLLEGSVKVTSGKGNAVLTPGQQARSGGASSIQVMTNVNLDKVMAWKNGLFDFQDATLEEVMRQLERWYDIEVSYEGKIPKLEFYGRMGKDLDLQTVLRGLEKSNVHFRMEQGRKLVIVNE